MKALSKTPHSGPKTIRLAIAQRGHMSHNIWVVWSYKLRKTLLLPSDAALCYVALLEGDSTIVSYELEAPSLVTTVNNAVVGTRFDATVRYVDGSVSWDEVKRDIDSTAPELSLQLQAQSQLSVLHGIPYRLFTSNDFLPKMNRVWNCLRMLQVLQAAQPFSVARSRTSVLSRLASGPATIGELKSLDQNDEALNLASVFGLMFESAIIGDLDSKPISDGSIVHLAGR